MGNVKFWCLNAMNKCLMFEFGDWLRLGLRTSVVSLGVLGASMAMGSSLETLDTFLKSTKSGRADFIQVVTPPTRAGQNTLRSKTSSGQFAFIRPTRFRFDYLKPFPQVIVADGQTLWLYDADLEQVTARSQAQALTSTPAALVATALDVAALQKEFVLTAQSESEGMQWVQAIPKNRESSIQSVRIGLLVDGVHVTLAKLEILDAMGQRSVLSFERFEVNPTQFGVAQFQFVTPKGVSVIRP